MLEYQRVPPLRANVLKNGSATICLEERTRAICRANAVICHTEVECLAPPAELTPRGTIDITRRFAFVSAYPQMNPHERPIPAGSGAPSGREHDDAGSLSDRCQIATEEGPPVSFARETYPPGGAGPSSRLCEARAGGPFFRFFGFPLGTPFPNFFGLLRTQEKHMTENASTIPHSAAGATGKRDELPASHPITPDPNLAPVARPIPATGAFLCSAGFA